MTDKPRLTRIITLDREAWDALDLMVVALGAVRDTDGTPLTVDRMLEMCIAWAFTEINGKMNAALAQEDGES